MPRQTRSSHAKTAKVTPSICSALLSLPADFSNQLSPYVQSKYQELWEATRGTGRRYIQLWRNKFLTVGVQNIDEMISILRDAATTLTGMRDDGVTLDPEGGTSDDYLHLVTTDPDVARKYDMHDESEFWGNDEVPDDSATQ
jgi:hypothetical protein